MRAVRLVQIEKRTGEIRRVPRGQTPIVELVLDDAQRVISIELAPDPEYGRSAYGRKTRGWTWTAYIEWSMEQAPPPAR